MGDAEHSVSEAGMKRTTVRVLAPWMLALMAVLTGVARAQDLAGNWQGTLQTGNGIRVVMKISKGQDGALKGLGFNADQPGPPLAMSDIALQGNDVRFAMKAMDMTYEGTMGPDHNSITGRLTQGGQPHQLNLLRVTEENTWAIPEGPKPMAPDARPKFDVVTVKPSDPNRPGKLFTMRGRRIVTINTTVNDLISFAYSVHPKQIVGGPDWFGTDKFDIDGVPDVVGQPNSEQFRLLIQDVLTQRFGLTFHRDKRELSVYALTVAKSGPKMTVTQNKPSDPRNFMFRGPGKLMVTNSTMEDICHGFQGAVMDKPVVDHTGLTERYDFNLNWTPDQSQFGQMGGPPPPPPSEDPNAPPSLYTALQEELGLKLEPTKAQAEALVIDHVEKPSAN